MHRRRAGDRHGRGERGLAPHFVYAVKARLFKGLTIIDRSIIGLRN